jgi:Zn/Cd-binding protein ZinT
MYKTIKGIYRKGQIVYMEPVEIDEDEVEVIITFLKEEKKEEEKIVSSTNRLLYTMGERAVEGKFTDASERHNHYLYGQKTGQ